jgi:hypothetical protein
LSLCDFAGHGDNGAIRYPVVVQDDFVAGAKRTGERADDLSHDLQASVGVSSGRPTDAAVGLIRLRNQ